MCCATQTILCFDCRKLFDVETHTLEAFGKQLAAGIPEELEYPFGPVPVHCPKSKKHKWRPWNFPDVCPKCGQPMEIAAEGKVIMWD